MHNSGQKKTGRLPQRGREGSDGILTSTAAGGTFNDLAPQLFPSQTHKYHLRIF